MKKSLLIILLIVCGFAFTQRNNTDNGYAAKGYDVVAYFSHKAIEGKKSFVTNYGGVSYKFSSATNLASFKKTPTKYLPQYGGWCAYAMAKKGEKVDVDPSTFEIRNGKLYLFYNSFFTNTKESWLEEKPTSLVQLADQHWKKLVK